MIYVDLKGKSPHELAEEDLELMRLWGEINNAWDVIERLLTRSPIRYLRRTLAVRPRGPTRVHRSSDVTVLLQSHWARG